MRTVGFKEVISVLYKHFLDLTLETTSAIDNQYFGIRHRAERLFLTYQLVTCNMCFCIHEWPNSFMAMNCVMLEPCAVGKFDLLHKSSRWQD